MDFRTRVEQPQDGVQMHLEDTMMLFGSCFSEHIGNLLSTHKFLCDVNPFGVLYNPSSISKALLRLCDPQPYQPDDLFFANGLWNSWMHHSSFSAPEIPLCLQQINDRLSQAVRSIRNARFIFITFGSAWVYRLRDTHECVANCHKQPDRLFDRSLLSVSEIVSDFQKMIEVVRGFNPSVHFILTVSPIRHIKDGLHGNQISKSTLLLAIEELCQRVDGITYFPAYEIMMDELRDYRFYADDMLHPSSLAIQYIWECFSAVFFDSGTKAFLREWQEVGKRLQHKPFNPQSDTYRRFLYDTIQILNKLQEEHPNLNFQKEIEQCQTLSKA